MVNLNYHEHKVEHLDNYSSEFLNTVINDFNDNIVKLYMEFKSIIKKHNEFNSVVNLGLDWYSEILGSLSLNDYAVTGYHDPTSFETMDVNKLFGQFYLQTYNVESKIGRYLDDNNEPTAYDSNKMYIYKSLTWVEDQDIRRIINNKKYIWYDEFDTDSIQVLLSIPSFSDRAYKANIIEVVPFAGTEIQKIEWKTSSGGSEQIVVNSKLPIQLVGSFDFRNELTVTLGGVLKDAKYYYSLRYIDVLRCDFVDAGTATYEIGEFADISNIEINDDYIDDDLKLKSPVRIEIVSFDESEVYYDSSVDPFPLENVIAINTTPVALKARVTLKKVEGSTPVIKYIDIE